MTDAEMMVELQRSRAVDPERRDIGPVVRFRVAFADGGDIVVMASSEPMARRQAGCLWPRREIGGVVEVR